MVKGPNRVWSINGHDKLSRFGFQVYAAIDAYSRYIVWCYIGHSNRTAISVNKQYLTTVSLTNIIPKMIRSDKGVKLYCCVILICLFEEHRIISFHQRKLTPMEHQRKTSVSNYGGTCLQMHKPIPGGICLQILKDMVTLMEKVLM